jgi:hypothetical protein
MAQGLTHFQGHFSQPWLWQVGNVKGYFVSMKPVTEGATALYQAVITSEFILNRMVCKIFILSENGSSVNRLPT